MTVHVCWYLTDMTATHGGILEQVSAAWLGTELYIDPKLSQE